MDKVYLNLGCFDKKFPKPYINVDIREDVNPDVVENAFELYSFKEDSVDLIYCSHMFEHLKKMEAEQALVNWNRVLKTGGILRLSVPDFEATCKRYLATGNIKEVTNLVCGSQKHDFDFHYAIYDKSNMTELLKSFGFDSIRLWNWWEENPHRYIDDFSRSYLPSSSPDIALSHGRIIKGDGMLMSLNIEGVKCKNLT